MWHPPYHPNDEKLERLLAVALEQGHRLGLGDLHVLDYLQLCEELQAKMLTVEKLSWALEENTQFLYPRLLGLEELGLIVSRSENRTQHWLVSKQGRSLLVDVADVGSIGGRLRPSSLTG